MEESRGRFIVRETFDVYQVVDNLTGTVDREYRQFGWALRRMRKLNQHAQRIAEQTWCDHDWQLVESGYVRTWSAQIDEATGTVSTGEGTFSDDGTDMSLQCLSCSETRSVEGLTIDWC